MAIGRVEAKDEAEEETPFTQDRMIVNLTELE